MTAQRENKRRPRVIYLFYFLCQDVSRSLSPLLWPDIPPFVPSPPLAPPLARLEETEAGREHGNLRRPLSQESQSISCFVPIKDPQKLSFRPTHGSLATSVTSSNSPAITTLGLSRGVFHPFLTFPYRTLPVLEPEFYFYTSSPLIKRNIKTETVPNAQNELRTLQPVKYYMCLGSSRHE